MEDAVGAMLSLDPKRRKILRDCIASLRRHGIQRYNAANVVVPTCISLIDGVLTDFSHDIGIDNWHNRGDGSFDRFRAEIESVAFAYDRPAISLIFDTLFSRSFYGELPESGRRFNRHPIGHGNWLEYGRLEHVIRLFLMLRFLDYIITEYWERKRSGSPEPVTQASQYSKMLSENPFAPVSEPMRDRLKARANEAYPALHLPAPQPSNADDYRVSGPPEQPS